MRTRRSFRDRRAALVAAALFPAAASAQESTPPDTPLVFRQPTWTADRAHSSLEFRTEHLGIVDVIGWFEDFDVVVYAESRRFEDATFDVRVRVASVRMPNPEMAGNLRGMLGAALHPEAVFRSRSTTALDAGGFRVTGDLTLNGITAPAEVRLHVNGWAHPPDESPGVTVRGTLERLEFDIGNSDLFRTTLGPLIGETVRITANLRLVIPGEE